MKLEEVQYKDFFKPETMAKLDDQSKENLRKVFGQGGALSVQGEYIKLLRNILTIESPYIPELEKLAVDIVKQVYPIIDYAGIEIDAKITNEPIEGNNNGEEIEIEPQIPEMSKRRIINAITHGSSIRGAFAFYLFKDNLDELDSTLLEKYKKLSEQTYGVFDDDNFVAMMLAMLAQKQKVQGGESKAEFDEEGNLKITARAINFPFLVHEIVKGLYEILSLQGFDPNKSKEHNQSIVNKVDKIDNEPEDMRYGKFIYDYINDIIVDNEIDDPRVREMLFISIYKLEEDEFMSFIENIINNKLTSQQKQWIKNELRDITSNMRKGDANLDENENKTN